MKFLLINAIENKSTIQEKYFPPLGLGYIAAYLKKYLPGIEIKIVEENIREVLEKFLPDIIGITALSQNYDRAQSISKMCKESGLPVIIGGPHITALPATLTADMDLAVLCEGEETVVEIMKTFQTAGMDMGEMAKIPGLAFYGPADKLVFTADRKPISPLDSIPFPDRDLLGLKKQRWVHLVSSRGCPYKCLYCASTNFWKGVRFFSAEYVIAELKMLVSRYAPDTICFYDDLFIADKKRLRKIVTLIKAEEINKKVDFFVTVRANLIDEETVRLLHEMNVRSINIGLESGNPRILQYLKDRVSLEDNLRAVQLMRKYDFYIGATFIIGSPDETKEDVLETLAFIKNNHIADTANVYILTPFPGTYFWEYAVKKNLVPDKMEWCSLNIESTDNMANRIILAEKMDRKTLMGLYHGFKALRKKAYAQRIIKQRLRKWLGNPREIFHSFYRYLKTRNKYNQKRGEK